VLELQPAQRRDDLLDRRLRRAREVGVLDAQDEVAAVVAREGPREQRGARGAQVQQAGGRRRDAGANALQAHSVSNPRCRSSVMSSTWSRPTARRSMPWPMPTAWRCSSLSLPCEVVAGCESRVLVSPRLVAMLMTRVRSMT
jgi:hypothetical protein